MKEMAPSVLAAIINQIGICVQEKDEETREYFKNILNEELENRKKTTINLPGGVSFDVNKEQPSILPATILQEQSLSPKLSEPLTLAMNTVVEDVDETSED